MKKALLITGIIILLTVAAYWLADYFLFQIQKEAVIQTAESFTREN